jgi:hypothetical protein
MCTSGFRWCTSGGAGSPGGPESSGVNTSTIKGSSGGAHKGVVFHVNLNTKEKVQLKNGAQSLVQNFSNKIL